MKEKEYRTASAARGGLLFMRDIPGGAFGERVIVKDHRGRRRNGQVIFTSGEVVLVQVFEGTDDLDLERTWVRFLEEPFEIPLSPDVLGRIFDGVGAPRDDRPPMIAPLKRNVNGAPVNPVARAYPQEFIQTGIAAIDGLNSLVRGQKLPIFSGSGLPHNRLAAQIVRQAKLLGEETRFVMVFAAMGVTYSDARFFQEEFENSGVLGKVVMYLNLADDPPIKRLLLPRTALACAEYLAFEQDLHVLVVMTDMTHYAEALREVATAKGDVPSRKGYPGYLYSDLAEIYERAGRIKNRRGSITMVPVVSMPSDDITHPIPDLTGYITEGQIVLSRELHHQGIYPPVNIPPSLSRLMKDGIGKNSTREDHPRVASQLYAAYAKALEVRNLASIIGAEELSPSDRQFLDFAGQFEQRFVKQGEEEDRSIIETLDLAWDLLSLLPQFALTRVTEADLAKYHKWEGDSEREAPKMDSPHEEISEKS
ncbi:Sodium-transporting two-sector ATPase [Nitrosococcus oceani ATCC 19707]|uniref:V-type ATP synthase beta chain n=2 Tax=Nitrosococcus oceani TaxID=1229 RepID=VATB_NITOC|nr:V-type ATP synthase subunit B [Nitrosococcus oceani]Q3J9F4.1 RecName: Full=V-type ATP synthase beta chain; AltName: Full=V-ATPase subunit B [Nitrosococcus oceani ATCC 19707]KFI19025.1 ATP synthase subunit B [Nitrosococcus oceani C-27]ABA58542.1 Sodium-transporting two-sector ATPase [Nitrosococcus oceani ATCC 19707]EDZ67793.1 ATP synthase alpha/beta family, nucleotide-binding domain protein [Nitrosococcus oceani AFC27]GEM19661.1 ATP synthase subunit beta [Nitrosococcus oceani]